MSLEALRPSPLVEQAAQRLRDQITGGQWPVGTKLPGETTLVAPLASAAPRSARPYGPWSAPGWCGHARAAGVFVIATEPTEDWPTRLRRAAVADVYEVRAMVEVQAARLAAARRTEADITAMRAALELRRTAAGADHAAFVDADIALHAAVVDAAHNPVLTDLFTEFALPCAKG